MFFPHFVGDAYALKRTEFVEPMEPRHDLLSLLGVKIDVSKGIDQRDVFAAQILLQVSQLRAAFLLSFS